MEMCVGAKLTGVDLCWFVACISWMELRNAQGAGKTLSLGVSVKAILEEISI